MGTLANYPDTTGVVSYSPSLSSASLARLAAVHITRGRYQCNGLRDVACQLLLCGSFERWTVYGGLQGDG